MCGTFFIKRSTIHVEYDRQDDVVCIPASEASVQPVGLLLHPPGSLLQGPGLVPLLQRLPGEGVGLLHELPGVLPGCAHFSIDCRQLGGELGHLGNSLVSQLAQLRPEEDSGGY